METTFFHWSQDGGDSTLVPLLKLFLSLSSLTSYPLCLSPNHRPHNFIVTDNVYKTVVKNTNELITD